MTLYLKYRPQTIDELDLESVRDSIRSIVKSGDIPHAFLFSGPKGTGKTSAARILAKIVNCTNLGGDGEPCNKCDACISIMKGNNIDIIELDAASNRGIDDIRSLKEGVYLAPAQVKKKVYIIDEAHMLTLEAANAFLKTLEEPPDHAVFILATTNPEKLPVTVISRLTQINFVKANVKDIERQLTRVAKGEKIKIEKKAVEKIAKLSDGSFRDAVKFFESLSYKLNDISELETNVISKLETRVIKPSDVESVFLMNDSKVDEFFEVLSERDLKKILCFIEEINQNGVLIRNFADEILGSIHKSILAKAGIGKDELEKFSLEELIWLNELISNTKRQISPIVQLPLEVAVIQFCGQKLEGNAKPEEKTEKPKKISEEKKEEKGDVKALNGELWLKVLQNAREKNVSMEALLRATTPISFDGKNLRLGVYYQFHKDKLQDVKNTKILEDICKGAFDVDAIQISFELIEKPKTTKASTNDGDLKIDVDKDIIEAAKEIFG